MDFLFETRDAQTRTVVLEPYSRALRTEYKEYGVQRISCLGSTNFGTEYGDFFEHGVRRVRSTKSTVLGKDEI